MEKLFYYNLLGEREESLNPKVFMISEQELPARSDKYSGCAVNSERIPDYVPIGSIIDIAAGDPIVLEKVKLLSRELNYEDLNIPDDVKEMSWIGKVKKPSRWDVNAFEYLGKRVWIIDDFVCLLDDLKRPEEY
jgi:hypothetical protein